MSNTQSRRVNGQFDDKDADYLVEVLRQYEGFRTAWSREHRNVTLRNAEALRRKYEAQGLQARVLHHADAP